MAITKLFQFDRFDLAFEGKTPTEIQQQMSRLINLKRYSGPLKMCKDGEKINFSEEVKKDSEKIELSVKSASKEV